MIPFNQLKPLQDLLTEEIASSMRRVAESGWYILGPEVEAFEREFAAYHKVDHAVGLASGTDAIELALRAGGIGPGDEVITVAHTAMATVSAIEATGAKPVLADIDLSTYTLDPQQRAGPPKRPHPRHRCCASLWSAGQPGCAGCYRPRARFAAH